MRDSYYSGSRDDLIRLIPRGATKILEIGCAAGMTGKALKEQGFEEVVGVEVVEEVARKAMPYYDRIIVSDVEKMKIPYAKAYFDCILYGDVLEHLVDPWRVLKEHNGLVRTGGAIICSVPNIRHYKVIKKLLIKGEWDYRDAGVLDRTHLRFFTLKSIKQMIADSGFEITTIVKRPSGAKWLKVLNRALRNRLIDHLVHQYVVVAIKR